MTDHLKYKFNLVLLGFILFILCCAPPQSFYNMEGDINLRNKINKIIKESEIDLNMSIQVISFKK